MNKILRNKEVVATILIIIATAIQFYNSVIQDEFDNQKDFLFEKNIIYASSAATFAANTADIILQRDLLNICEINNRDDCGTVQFLLEQDIFTRDGIRAFTYESQQKQNSAVVTYQNFSEMNSWKLDFTERMFYLLMVLAIIINLGINRNKDETSLSAQG